MRHINEHLLLNYKNIHKIMGLILEKLYNLLNELGFSEPKRICMLGLDAAGKTTILYKLKLNENVSTIPTIGFNVEEVKIGKGLTFTIWDVGGQERIRSLWHHYFSRSHLLIYVVDSNDNERLNESKEELFSILKSDELREVILVYKLKYCDKVIFQIPIIVIANKQDLPNAMSTGRIVDGLELRKLERTHKWHVQACCAISGEGLYEAMDIAGKMSSEYIKTHKGIL